MLIQQGTRLGRYEVLSLLGKGGMGEVYLAHDTQLRRNVAIKFLHFDSVKDPVRLARFEREAYAASSLNHPNILTIYEIGQHDGHQYISTEYIEGASLRQLCRDGRMELREILDIASQVADALSAAHENGIVHRDLKPENIMIRKRDGYAKVLDFGLVKLIETTHFTVDHEASTEALINTEPGLVLGTIQYLSPEQLRGIETDARTDLWSLGVLLFEVITGQLPFTGDTKTDLMAAIVNKEPPPLARFSRELPEMLEWIVTKALRKNRDERYQTARELLTDLRGLKQRITFDAELERSVPPPSRTGAATAERVLTDSTKTIEGHIAASTSEAVRLTSNARPAAGDTSRHTRKLLLALVGVAVVVSAIFAANFFRKKFATPSARPFSQIKLTRLTTSGKVAYASISPDGKYITTVAGDPGQQSVWLHHILTASDKEIAPAAGVSYGGPFFSPDGNYIYYSRTGMNLPNYTYQVAVLGGAPKLIIEDVDSQATLPTDGKRFAFIRGYPSKGTAALMIANLDGSGEQQLATYDIVDFFPLGNTMSPAWSPNGETIVIGVPAQEGNARFRQMVAVKTTDGTATPIGSKRWTALGQFAWLPDGSGLVFTGSDQPPGAPQQIWHISYPAGEARQISNDLNDYHGMSITSDSKSLVTVQRDRTASIWIKPIDTSAGGSQLTSNKYDGMDGFSFAPDDRLVYTSRTTGNPKLWIIKADGTGKQQLTDGDGGDFTPSVSPDGRYVAFISDRSGTQNVWRIDIDGRNPKQLTKGRWDQHPSWSADNKWLIYTSNDGSRQTLWKVPMDGGDSVQLTDYTASRGVVSPDGKQLAFAYFEGETKPPKHMAAIMSIDGGQPLKKFDFATARQQMIFKWTADGKNLIYILTRAGISNIWMQPIDGGAPKQLTDFKSGLIFYLDRSADGTKLGLAQGTLNADGVLITDSR